MRMKSDMLRWIDEKVKEHVFANRTHAVEFAVRQLMNRDQLQRK
jgi:Arc/MetJ-type ribon-helix-helix transcriptional regulator